MKTINRLYQGLTSIEAAGLAFHYTITQDHAEVEKVTASVPQRAYMGADWEFRNRYYCLMSFQYAWSLDYWRLRSLANTLLAGVLAAETSGKFFDSVLDRLRNVEGYLLALDDALEAVCAEHSMVIEAVRRFAGAEQYQPMEQDSKLDTAWRDFLLDTWRNGVLSGWVP